MKEIREEEEISLRTKAANIIYQTLHALTGPGKGVRVILLYHSVSRGPSASSYSVPFSVFKVQMRFLKEHFKVVRLRDLNQTIETSPPNVNIACVTFDDGCMDNFEIALPCLEQIGIKATFFIPTGVVGKTLKGFIGEMPIMGRGEIRELWALGHDIGAHSVNHAKLSRLPIDVARYEMKASKDFLEDLLGSPVVSFAYPKGDYNADIKNEAGRLGFQYAVTTSEGLVYTQPDWLALPRVWIHKDLSMRAFSAKLSPAVEWYWRLRGVQGMKR